MRCIWHIQFVGKKSDCMHGIQSNLMCPVPSWAIMMINFIKMKDQGRYKFVISGAFGIFNLWGGKSDYMHVIESNLCKCHWQKILLCQSVVWTQTGLPSVLAGWRLLIVTPCRPGGVFLSLGGCTHSQIVCQQMWYKCFFFDKVLYGHKQCCQVCLPLGDY